MNSTLKSIQRSWRHHFGTQISTLIVLCGAFTVIVCTLLISQNLTRVLSSWGETVQVTAYVDENALDGENENLIDQLEAQIKNLSDIVKVEFVDKEQATEKFKAQMASYAPGLLNDSDFANPFPASFRLTLKDGTKPEQLKQVSDKIQSLEGIEEVSYGQSWISNYSVFAKVISNVGRGLVLLLLAGGLMIVGNAVRASVAVRREDIEILELVGATKSMIRTPFLVEGALLGFVSAALALLANFGLYTVATKLLSQNLNFMRFTEILAFANAITVLGILALGTFIGFLGAYIAVRSLNDGWAASRRSINRGRA